MSLLRCRTLYYRPLRHCGLQSVTVSTGFRTNRSFNYIARREKTILLKVNEPKYVSYWRYFAENLPDTSGRSTIFALSSGVGKCGVMVFRVSGPLVREVMRKVARCKEIPEARKAMLKRFHHPVTGEVIDRGLLLWFPGPNSFTGEDCCEFHVHGSLAVSSAIIDAIGSIPGLCYAGPGEFTRRSFQNGKLDLTEVEGLADLIHAETEAQRRQALQQMDGALSKIYMKWREEILKCVAHLEAFIDFSEEENLEDGIIEYVLENILHLKMEIEHHLADNRRGERLRSGVQVAIIGEPNVGKSSLLNALCQRPAAIVSPVAGTTRDIIETTLNIAGYPVIVSDTAGLRVTNDVLEMEGVRRAVKRSKEADLVLLVIDVNDSSVRNLLLDGHSAADQFVNDHLKELHVLQSCEETLNQTGGSSLTSYGVNELDRGVRSTDLASSHQDGSWSGEVILVLNKQDLLPPEIQQHLLDAFQSRLGQIDWCFASCCAVNGLDSFLDILTRKLKTLCTSASTESPMLTNERHRLHLAKCLRFLTAYSEEHSMDSVLGAEDLRRAVHQIAKITGRVTSEDVLDVIFRDFCIGK